MGYPSDLSHAEWDLIAPDFQPKTKRDRPRSHDQKSIVDAILYVLKGGIPWRLMTYLLGKRSMTTLVAGTSRAVTPEVITWVLAQVRERSLRLFKRRERLSTEVVAVMREWGYSIKSGMIIACKYVTY